MFCLYVHIAIHCTVRFCRQFCWILSLVVRLLYSLFSYKYLEFLDFFSFHLSDIQDLMSISSKANYSGDFQILLWCPVVFAPIGSAPFLNFVLNLLVDIFHYIMQLVIVCFYLLLTHLLLVRNIVLTINQYGKRLAHT